ncbi:hypothetical protein [Spiroplasma endosymbiont of Crioceris asparagi]|uniref:hypothetical protein n=1 Tax=Spiroplasma endosymbiont of Crioceris asparagi TaxID=3066286 RepID=UPI0030D572A5
MKEIKSVLITNKQEIQELEQEFLNQEEKISKKIYVSMSEERARTIKLFINAKIKFDLEKVRETFFNLIVKDLHPNLQMTEIQENGFYRGSGRINKVAFKITKFNEEEITVMWYNADQKFIKRIKINQAIFNKKKTKISYTGFVTGMNSIETYFEKRIKTVYLKREKIAFKINILRLKQQLGLIESKKAEKKIQLMLNFAKELF